MKEPQTCCCAGKVDGPPLPLGRSSISMRQTTNQGRQLLAEKEYWSLVCSHPLEKGRTLRHHTAGGFGTPAAPSLSV